MDTLGLAALAADPAAWAALVTLVVMEVVLGIDNLVFISILSNKLPEHHLHHHERHEGGPGGRIGGEGGERGGVHSALQRSSPYLGSRRRVASPPPIFWSCLFFKRRRLSLSGL